MIKNLHKDVEEVTFIGFNSFTIKNSNNSSLKYTPLISFEPSVKSSTLKQVFLGTGNGANFISSERKLAKIKFDLMLQRNWAC